MTFAHMGGGPLDLAIEFGLPLVIFLALYFWSSRGPGPAQRREAERRRAAGDPEYYTALSTSDLESLAKRLESNGADGASIALRERIASELARRASVVRS